MNPEAIFDAIRSNDAARARELLAADPALASARNADGLSALTIAAYYRRAEIVRDLLARGIALDIWEAATVGDSARVRELLTADPALVNSVSPDGFAPLGLAAYFGHYSTAEALVDAGADVNATARNPSRVRPLHSAAANANAETALDMARLLLLDGADANAAQQGGWTPLHQAADNNNPDLVAILLVHYADPFARADNGQTALDMALARGATAAAAHLRRAMGLSAD